MGHHAERCHPIVLGFRTIAICSGRIATGIMLGITAASSVPRCALSQEPRLEAPIRVLNGDVLQAGIGTVTDLGLDTKRNIYVLDGAQGVVEVFRWDGSLLAKATLDSERVVVGKAMAVTQSGLIFVLPQDGRELLELELDGTAIRRLSRFPISVVGGDLCACQHSIFVVGFDPQSRSLVHEYSFDGRAGRQFGADLVGDAPAWAVADFQGRIACSEDAVALGSGFSPTVELYDENGHLIWRRDVRPYRGLLIRPSPDNGYSLTVPSGGADVVWSLLLFNRTVAVQLRRSGNVTPHLATLVYSAGSASQPDQPRSPWPLVKRVYGTLALTGSAQPNLSVEIRRIHIGGR